MVTTQVHGSEVQGSGLVKVNRKKGNPLNAYYSFIFTTLPTFMLLPEIVDASALSG